MPLQIESWPQNVISGQERLDGRSAHSASAFTGSSPSDVLVMVCRSFEKFRQVSETTQLCLAAVLSMLDCCQPIYMQVFVDSGLNSNASGSAYAEFCNTKVMAAV